MQGKADLPFKGLNELVLPAHVASLLRKSDRILRVGSYAYIRQRAFLRADDSWATRTRIYLQLR